MCLLLNFLVISKAKCITFPNILHYTFVTVPILPNKKLSLGIAGIFAEALLKSKPQFSLKKLSDKSIHVSYSSEVGKWTLLSLGLIGFFCLSARPCR